MEYLRAFATQEPVVIPAAQRVVLDKVIRGEYPIALMTLSYHCDDQRGKKGAPSAVAEDAADAHVAEHDQCAEECAASERGAVADRVHAVRRRPADHGGERLHARQIRRCR